MRVGLHNWLPNCDKNTVLIRELAMLVRMHATHYFCLRLLDLVVRPTVQIFEPALRSANLLDVP
jgi:hypothetical protein